jgi:predicted SAM-dependent methyltransferase
MWNVGYRPHIVVGPKCSHAEITATTSLLGNNEKTRRFKHNQELFRRKYGEEGTDWNLMPKYQPPPELHRIGWIISKVAITDKILELGCAENPTWVNTPFKVTTVDISRRPDENCFPDVIADAASLPLGDKSYDIVCANELLEHVADPQSVLREAIRVARKKVIITVPAEHLWAPALRPFNNPVHVRFYTKETLHKELETLRLPFSIELIKFKYWRHYGAIVNCDGSEAMEKEKIKINWGSFKDTFGAGWLNVDILNVKPYIPADHKFKQWDVRQRLTWLADNSVDLHRVSHLIEHLTLDEAKIFLSELYRTLKPGGLVRIATPDLDIIVKHYYNRDMSFFNAVEQPPEYIQAPTMGEKLSRLIFSGDYQHKAIYTFEMLRNFLEQAGFQSRAGFTKIFRGVPGFSHSEAMQMETNDQHQDISLYVEAIK